MLRRFCPEAIAVYQWFLCSAAIFDSVDEADAVGNCAAELKLRHQSTQLSCRRPTIVLLGPAACLPVAASNRFQALSAFFSLTRATVATVFDGRRLTDANGDKCLDRYVVFLERRRALVSRNGRRHDDGHAETTYCRRATVVRSRGRYFLRDCISDNVARLLPPQRIDTARCCLRVSSTADKL